MSVFSRRQLARYAVRQLLEGQSPSMVARHLAAALIVSKKHKETDLLVKDIALELESRRLLVQATVTTAHQLTAELRKEITARLKQATGTEEVTLEEKVNENVIGGVRIETAAHSWDETILHKLSDIRGGI